MYTIATVLTQGVHSNGNKHRTERDNRVSCRGVCVCVCVTEVKNGGDIIMYDTIYR